MERTSKRPCPIARAAEQLGDTWTLLIMRDVFLGKHRFADLQGDLGIAPNILTARLAKLEAGGLLESRLYSKHPPRSEYVLTKQGEALLPILMAFAAYGNDWLAPDGEPLLPVDAKSGRVLEPVVLDKKSKKPFLPGQVALKAGPGAPKALKAQLKSPRVLEGRAR